MSIDLKNDAEVQTSVTSSSLCERPDNLIPQALLETRDLRRVFSETGEQLEILKGVNFSMNAGELVALTGSSGSGKSTFLNLVGMLDTPTSGEILFKGKELSKFSSHERDMYHRAQVGFVFQFHHLLSEFSALENVCVPGRILGTSEAECRERAEMLLETVGLKDRLKHLPRELSGGERQRIAIARALMNKPDLVLADEPSGNLDEANSAKLNELIGELNEKFNQAFLIVTHDEMLAKFAKRRVVMHNGLIQSIE
ncbi:ABC transporter ATP-binding protein [Fibrobacter sp. UWH1]|uniref:ABC transporter ATP-binding protein n=1 Tax=Fibrobacter sp. UWH1 TaxID=1964354 RepID=UPI000B51F7FF|nr:ABC transporter ATP-binding protein [Fibrobacter sp. UWH1]OWV15604.1 ABC transporter ATP-binding protein [Fibrobacter sp. UWH1]